MFVHILEEFEDTKNHFEINWPLGLTKIRRSWICRTLALVLFILVFVYSGLKDILQTNKMGINYKSHQTKDESVEEFHHLFSENCISWIFKLFFENAHKWKPHHWNPHEPRTLCTAFNICHWFITKIQKGNDKNWKQFEKRINCSKRSG